MFVDELMQSLEDVRGLLAAKWRGVAGAGGVPRDNITQEADKILKKATSKFLFKKCSDRRMKVYLPAHDRPTNHPTYGHEGS